MVRKLLQGESEKLIPSKYSYFGQLKASRLISFSCVLILCKMREMSGQHLTDMLMEAEYSTFIVFSDSPCI